MKFNTGKNLLSADPVFVKFVRYNLKVLYSFCVCNCCLKNNIHTQIVGMFIIYLHVKFNIPSCNDLLLTAAKLKAKPKFCVPACFTFYLKVILTEAA
jgi:hypothetical protein